jgi:twitching motility protein PilJ
LIVLVAALFLFAISDFVALYMKSDQDRQAIGYTTRIQVLSQQIVQYATEAAGGNELAFQELQSTSEDINAAVQALSSGDKTGMSAYHGEAPAELDALSQSWAQLQGNVSRILSNKNAVLGANAGAKVFTDKLSALNSSMSEVVNTLTDKNASTTQVYIAARQIHLTDRMGSHVAKILTGSAGTQDAATSLDHDAHLYQSVVNALLNGAPELNIHALDNANAKQIVSDVATQWAALDEPLKKVLGAVTSLEATKSAATAVFDDSQSVLAHAINVAQRINELPRKRMFPNPIWGAQIAVAAILLLLFLGASMLRAQRRRYQRTRELNQRNQDAILRLLDEMEALAEGDLTVNATVTDDITGEIADAVNYTVEALRSLVTTINQTAVQVSTAAQETQGTTIQVAEASQHQARQIAVASTAISEMADSINTVSKHSADSDAVAQRSVQIAANGAQVVRRTIAGMDSIREQIQETSKRIKRLGESSQEIGSIVEFIDDIAEQTNILALNAAIQAVSAGEAGRGFVAVVDEVQRLAERVSGATKRIGTLVQAIQSDTSAAVGSMEQTTSEVVSGAHLAGDAGRALGEIQTVSNHLAGLIQGISVSVQRQSDSATNIAATMHVIQGITSQTSVSATQTAESIGHLTEMAADLRHSVADFKLPE